MNKSKTRNRLFFLLCLVLSIPAEANPLYFNIVDYGATGDGKTMSTKSINTAIEACSNAGGGTVWFPAGIYVSGTIYLKSNVTLFLDAGSVLAGSKMLDDYPVTVSKVRSYTDNYTVRSLIYAEDLDNIAILGKGLIDGNGSSFEHNGPYKNRPYLIRVINCKNVTVRDVRIINSPMWVQHYMACQDVLISGITVNSRVNSNNDGIDIDGCDRVRISDCSIISGDDAIVLKSTFDKACSNVTIANCVLSSDCNAFKLGTETNGGFQNITLSNCTIYDTHLAGITLQLVDGGKLDRVSVSNVTMDNVGTALFIRLGNRARPFEENGSKPGMGTLSNVNISNVTATKVGVMGCAISGIPGFPVENIYLDNIRLSFSGGGTPELAERNIPEASEDYPEFDMFGKLPAYGFYCRHVKNVRFSRMDLSFENTEARPAIVCDDIAGLNLQDISARVMGPTPVLWFKDVRNAFIQSCMTTENTENFLRVSGIPGKNIVVSGNDLRGVKHVVFPKNDSTVLLINNITSQVAPDNYVNCEIQYTDDRKIKIHATADIIKKRREIIFAIWGEDHLPDRADAIVSSNIESPLSPNSSLLRVDKIEIPSRVRGVNGIDTLKDLAYFFVPVRRNNRLVIFSPGHLCNFKHLPTDDHDYGVENTILSLLQAGYDVLAVYMPHVTENGCNLDHCAVMNSYPDSGKYPVTFGLRFFLEPTIRCLNYLLQHNTYKNVNMAGLSGGGWTTNLLAAIDDRIKYSFSIAGSMPLYYRYGSSMGDIEQFVPELYRDIAGYPDLYILGAYGPGRKQIQILNRHDDCCFGENQHDPARNYDADIKTFQKVVKDNLQQLNSEGQYRLLIDDEAPNHQISPNTLQVILKELMK